MSIDCRCDECDKIIDIGETTICQKCHNQVLDNIESLKEKIEYLNKYITDLENSIEEIKR